MTKKHYLVVVIFNFLLALAFYIQGLSANVTDISGDLANIIPVCKKIDNPALFISDIYLDPIENVKYYTPFYVQTLRFFARFTNYDYVQALNILGFLTHFLYGLLWFLLFYTIKKDFWLAFIFSIFFRGITWPPGMELLGISDIWTIMPRTIFLTVIPIPYLIFRNSSDKFQYLAALILGLLVNLHPISGVGCILVYVTLYFSHLYFDKNNFGKVKYVKMLSCFSLIIIGMSPYLWSYFVNVKTAAVVNQELFEVAFRARLDPVFFDSLLFLKSWFKPVTCFFVAGFVGFYFIDSSAKKQYSKIILSSMLVLLVFCNAIMPIENLINITFKTSFRFSFQIIRSQKFVLVLLQIATFLFFYELVNKYKITDNIKIGVCVIYLLVISLSTAPIINKLALFGEDITTFIFPNCLKFYKVKPVDKLATQQVHDFVNKNTQINDVFYAQDMYFRSATNRAEVLDFHAAGMLIEGNQKAYTDIYLTLIKFQKANESEKISILHSKNVDYIIVREKWKTLKLVYNNSEYNIYKL